MDVEPRNTNTAEITRELISELKPRLLKECQVIRVFHGRSKNGYLQGFNIDFLDDTLFIKSYLDFELEFKKLCVELSSELSLNVVLYHKRNREFYSQGIDLPCEKVIREHDVRYLTKLGKDQNIGFFPDAFYVRKWLLQNSREKKVLNLFSYTCSLSVACVVGGATKVINIDMKSNFLEWGRKNHQLNELDKSKYRFEKKDIMKSLGFIKKLGHFDLVILDPPTFQKKSFNASIHYQKLTQRLYNSITDDGYLLAGLNDPFTNLSKMNEMVCEGELFEFIQRFELPEEFKEEDDDRSVKFCLYRKL